MQFSPKGGNEMAQVSSDDAKRARPTSRTPSKAQRSGFARKKEEGESIMEFSP